jgi:cytochrome c556
MYRRLVLAGVLVLAVLAWAAAALAEDKDKDKKDKPKSISAILKKAHAGDEAFRASIAEALKEKDFEKAGTTMKAWGALAPHLGDFDPPKGDKKSWEKLTKKYANDVKALSKAVTNKNAKAATAALKTINDSCGKCHTAHRPKK